VPPPLAEQLAHGGRLVEPIGPDGDDEVVLFEHRNGMLRTRRRVSAPTSCR
jgi:protein-L-isoaspartate(D-aspartate) O-methyltransferase